jgi:hypothetical protein
MKNRTSVVSDYHSGGQNGRMAPGDFYSQDAKLQRKAKRRKVYPADGNEELRFDDRRVRSDHVSDVRGFEGRRLGPGQGPSGPGYQGPEHLRRGPRRGGRGLIRNTGGESGAQQLQNTSQNTSQNYQNPIIPNTAPTNFVSNENEGEAQEAAPLTLLQKLATMIQKAKQ